MNWKHSFRPIYYDGAPEPADLDLPWSETALLVIDVQNTYPARPDRATLSAEEQRRSELIAIAACRKGGCQVGKFKSQAAGMKPH